MTPKRLLLVAGSLGVVVIAALVWWVTRPAPAEVDISAALEAATASPTGPAVTSGSSAATSSTDANPTAGPSTSADSTAPTSQGAALEAQVWTVSTTAVPYDFAGPTGTFVGFRIDEELASVGAATAVARTPEVTGTVTLADTTISQASFSANMIALESDRPRRDGAIQGALHTDVNPMATFELTSPIELDGVPPIGEAISAQATGDLTINGVTQAVTMPLQAALVAQDELVVTSSFDVSLSDHEIEPPSAPAVVSVSGTATVELQLYLVP